MADLSVDWAGVRLKNPIVVAASSLCNNIEKMARLEAADVAALITKVVSRKEHFPPAWIHGFPYLSVVQGDNWLLRGVK